MADLKIKGDGMRTKRQLFAAIAAATAAATLLGACSSGGGQAASPAPTSTANLKGTSINYWVWKDVPSSKIYEQLAAEFQKQTGITVNLTTGVTYKDFYTNLVNSIAAGNGPDATEINTNMLGELASASALANLQSDVQSWKGAKAIPPSLWSFVSVPNASGTYALPFKYLMYLMYYRKDLLQQAGVQVPQTQQQFVAAVKAVTQHGGGHYGFDLRGANGWDQWAAFVVAGGGRFNDLNSAAAQTANELYTSTYKYDTPGTISQNSGSALGTELEAGTVAMVINHISLSRQLTDLSQIGVAPVPSISGSPANTTYDGTMNMNAVLASSKKQAAAFAWIAWLDSAQAQLQVAQSPEGYIPVIPAITAKYFANDRFIQTSMAESQNTPQHWPAVPGTAKAAGPVWPPLFQGALLGKNSPDALLQGVSAALSGSGS